VRLLSRGICDAQFETGRVRFNGQGQGVIRVIVEVVDVIGRLTTGDNNLGEFCIFDSYAEMVPSPLSSNTEVPK
jgi:hypothetical protein